MLPLLGFMKLLLSLTHGCEVLVQLALVPSTDSLLHPPRAVAYRVEDTLALAQSLDLHFLLVGASLQEHLAELL